MPTITRSDCHKNPPLGVNQAFNKFWVCDWPKLDLKFAASLMELESGPNSGSSGQILGNLQYKHS